MGIINWYGLVIMAVIMVPNLLFMRCHPDGFENRYHNRLVETLEQVGRFGSFALMVVNLPGLCAGFWFAGGCATYIAANALLCALYCAGWAVFWNRPGLARSLALSILPSLIFVQSGVLLGYWPLLLAALVFAPCHILISVRNAAAQ